MRGPGGQLKKFHLTMTFAGQKLQKVFFLTQSLAGWNNLAQDILMRESNIIILIDLKIKKNI
jgi:5-methylcytosine-specific restriction endonuclease McrBC regulatory subunit McrC